MRSITLTDSTSSGLRSMMLRTCVTFRTQEGLYACTLHCGTRTRIRLDTKRNFTNIPTTAFNNLFLSVLLSRARSSISSPPSWSLGTLLFRYVGSSTTPCAPQLSSHYPQTVPTSPHRVSHENARGAQCTPLGHNVHPPRSVTSTGPPGRVALIFFPFRPRNGPRTTGRRPFAATRAGSRHSGSTAHRCAQRAAALRCWPHKKPHPSQWLSPVCSRNCMHSPRSHCIHLGCSINLHCALDWLDRPLNPWPSAAGSAARLSSVS